MEGEGPSKAMLEKEREERIRARRERIAEKIAAQKTGVDLQAQAELRRKQEADALLPQKGLSEVRKARSRLSKFAAQRDEEVTDVRVQADDREAQRRTNEEALRVDRRHKLLFEAESSARRNAAIAMKWSSLFEIDVPMDLHHDMEAQQAACWRIIEAKDNLIRDFQIELKNKDEQYVKALRQGVQDLDSLQDSMARNASRQQMLYEQETLSLESNFEAERKGLIEQCRKEWDKLFDKSLQQQLRQKAEREKRVDLNQEKLVIVHRHDTEDFHTLKVRMECVLQEREQQLEDMRATYQLNTEKLEYNFRVLHERNEENQNTINANKRKLARLQDNLSNLMAKYAALDNKYKAENNELSESYQRYTQFFMDLKEKLSHFQKSDSKRYFDVWNMHEQLIKAKLLKCLQADKIIHEQQLGLLWFPPNEEELNKVFTKFREREFEKVMARMRKEAGRDGLSQSEDMSWDAVLKSQLVESPAIEDMCQMICDKTGFLMDAHVKEMLKKLQRDKGRLFQIKTVLKALGISKAEDVQMLLSFFRMDSDDGGSESHRNMSPSSSHEVDLVSDDQVIDTLKRFVHFRGELKQELTGTHSSFGLRTQKAAGTQEEVSGDSSKHLEDKDSERQPGDKARETRTGFSSNHLAVGDYKSVWDLCKKVISPDTILVWKQLERFQKQYNVVLQERANLIEDVNTLIQQNKELKMLLNQYLTSKVNNQLYIPPTATISRVEN